MKKFLSLILALALVLSLGAAQAEQKVYRIGCSLFSFSDNFQSLYRAELERYIASLETDEVCYVGADARQSGTMQGEIVRDLPNHGDINGDGKVSYIMIEGELVENYYRVDDVRIDRDHLE